MAAQSDVDLQAWSRDITQHFRDPADGLAALGRVLDQLGHNILAVLSLAGLTVGNENLVADAGIVRNHQTEALLFIVAPNDLAVAALQNLYHRAFAAAPAVITSQTSQCLVAIEQIAHLAGRQEQIIAAIVRDKEAEAVFFALNAACDQIHMGRQAIDAAAIADDLPVPAHGDQAATQRLLMLVRLQMEHLTELLQACWFTNGFKLFEDEFPAGNGVGVVVGFALGVGILRFAGFGH